MGVRHEGVSGKWDALTEERDRLREQVEKLSTVCRDQRNQLAELQAGQALKISTVHHLLRQMMAEGAEPASELVREIAASIEQADARAQEAYNRTSLKLDDEEQEAWDALSSYMRIVMHRWKLRVNISEITAAVHVLQGAVTQHMLTRLAPGEWSSWWEKPNDQEET